MESLIPVINDLQNVFKKTQTSSDTIQLPQIVVVGSQSCGKSSVLESLVKKSFLPRGTGIVTRCPIILQLVNTPCPENTVHTAPRKSSNRKRPRRKKDEDGECSTEWCSFPASDDPAMRDSKFYDFDEVREYIEAMTNEMAGSNKGISMDPITVKVCSPNVIPLTVVDLPGVVKNPVGDQPDDIEDQVMELIKKYVTNPSAIILAVSSAEADIATSESLKIAKEVDPKGRRTLAVITKLDRLEEGMDANKVLSGDVIQVKLGIIGVVNRSQIDINNNKSINDAKGDELAFFHRKYPAYGNEIGSEYLAKRLNELLMKHIKDSLPDLITRIRDLTEDNERKIRKIGPKIAEDSMDKIHLMIEYINQFHTVYRATIKDRQPPSATDGELFTVKITEALDKYSEILRRDCLIGGLGEKIEKAIENSVNVERFTSVEDVFKSLSKQHIHLLEKPFVQCAVEVHEILKRAIDPCLRDQRLESLNVEIGRVTRKLINHQLVEAKKSISEYILIQRGMIFSSDDEFYKLLNVSNSIDGVRHASFPLTSTANGGLTSQADYVKKLIQTYVNVMRRQVADYMPKHLMYHLFECTMKQLKEKLRQAIAGKEMDLVSEPEKVLRKRREIEEMLQNLHQASDIIGGVQSKG